MRPIVAFDGTFGRIFVIVMGGILILLSAACRPIAESVDVITQTDTLLSVADVAPVFETPVPPELDPTTTRPVPTPSISVVPGGEPSTCEGVENPVVEMQAHYYRLLEAGAEVQIDGPEVKAYQSKHDYPVKAEASVSEVTADDFDAVVVPGGYDPDLLRRYPAVLDLVRDIFEKDGLVATICHAAWVPISAGIMNGRRATCVSAIKDDLVNAGATYVDQ